MMRKGLTPYLYIGLIVIAVIIMIFQFFTLMDVNYSIRFEETKIKRGDDLTLYYKITNGFPSDVTNVYLYYNLCKAIIEEGDVLEEEIGIIKMFQAKMGHINFSTKSLSSGEYSICTFIDYEVFGSYHEKDLSLDFELF